MDACIHPGLLEHLEDDLSDLEKRQILIDAMMECSSYEIDALLYIRYGDHGSDHIGVLTEILANNNIKSVTVVRMEVPCCGGIEQAAKAALRKSGKFIPWQVYTISTEGQIIDR